MAAPVFIHVGFANSGTTSLQRNFFSARDDIFYAGEPYGERGGIFSTIKNVEDINLDAVAIDQQCRDLIHRHSAGRPIVISDETLTDTPQLYFAPYTMPREAIALRLCRLFPAARIIFTIRDQRHYAESMYLNLKRNTARFDRMPIAPFSQWLTGNLTLLRANYLQNLNFFECVSLYAEIFGHENICVLPLEMAMTDGTEAYLGHLCSFMGMELRHSDVTGFRPIHNRRMSVHQELVAELVEDERFARLYAHLSNSLGAARLTALLEDAPPSSVAMQPTDERQILRRVGIGNWLLAQEFGLDLERYGYPLGSQHELSSRQLRLAERQLAFGRDTARLRGRASDAGAAELSRYAELAVLRAELDKAVSELAFVSNSPVWRTVKRVENVRHYVLRAAAMITAAAVEVRAALVTGIRKRSASDSKI
jgi:hypothetical protein